MMLCARSIRSVRRPLIRNVASRAARQPRPAPAGAFGDLSRSGSKNLEILAYENYSPDDPDGYDKQVFDTKPRKNEFYYKWEISNNARMGKTGLRRALELFKQMKQEDRLTPNFNHFSALIYGCAKAGQTKKAFELYEEARKYTKKPSGAMVTCLMNACAESPFPEYGLERLDWFRKHLETEFDWKMNEIQFRCLIKAYGKLGRIDLAGKVFQEMIDAGFPPSTDAFNMLMIGCASQMQTGTLLALRIYKRMRLYGIKPDSITYGNLLRCILYCGVGSPGLLNQTLMELPAMTTFEQRIAYKAYKKRSSPQNASKEFEWLPSILELGSSVCTATSSKSQTSKDSHLKLIEDRKQNDKELVQTIEPANTSLQPLFLKSDDLPNLLSDDHLTLMHRIKAIQYDKLNSGPARFQLFGGPEGFLNIMKRDDCEPDIKLFTRLAALVSPDRLGLLSLFHLVKEYPVTRNEYFYNNLIKYASTNWLNPKRLDLALCFVEEMQRDGMRPSISTFECLGPACDSLKQASKLIDDIERCGFAMSDEIIVRLFQTAAARKEFKYLIRLMELCREKFNWFRPTRDLVELLEETRIASNEILAKHEKGKLSERDTPNWIREDNIADYDRFKSVLGSWLKTVPVQRDEHPWEQFDVKIRSRRQGFVDYVKTFQALERSKREAAMALAQSRAS